jgi:hypothetical protein
MVVKMGKKSIKGLVGMLNLAVRGVTGSKLINKVGKESDRVLKRLGKFVARIPIAGGLFAYVFVQTGKGLVIITTTADKLVNSSGKIVISALGGAEKLSVWTLDTIKGVATKVVSGVTKRIRRGKKRGTRKKRKRKKTRSKRR